MRPALRMADLLAYCDGMTCAALAIAKNDIGLARHTQSQPQIVSMVVAKTSISLFDHTGVPVWQNRSTVKLEAPVGVDRQTRGARWHHFLTLWGTLFETQDKTIIHVGGTHDTGFYHSHLHRYAASTKQRDCFSRCGTTDLDTASAACAE
ncbi:MAG: hypothetical protein V4754_10370 [Pseudomonadota bacterium]